LYPNLTDLFFAVDVNLCKNQAKCISTLIKLLDNKTDPDTIPAKNALGNKVLNLAKVLEPEVIKENYTMIRFLQSVFGSLCVLYIDDLLEVPDFKLLGIMQKLVVYYSEECKGVCNFWKSYLKQISLQESREESVKSLQEIIKNLIIICLDKMLLPEDIFMDLNAVDYDADLLKEIKGQRKFFRRILKQIGACVEAKDYWSLLNVKFMECIQALSTNSTDRLHWMQLEAILISLSALLKGNILIKL